MVIVSPTLGNGAIETVLCRPAVSHWFEEKDALKTIDTHQ